LVGKVFVCFYQVKVICSGTSSHTPNEITITFGVPFFSFFAHLFDFSSFIDGEIISDA